jgi:hypothetical protein
MVAHSHAVPPPTMLPDDVFVHMLRVVPLQEYNVLCGLSHALARLAASHVSDHADRMRRLRVYGALDWSTRAVEAAQHGDWDIMRHALCPRQPRTWYSGYYGGMVICKAYLHSTEQIVRVLRGLRRVHGASLVAHWQDYVMDGIVSIDVLQLLVDRGVMDADYLLYYAAMKGSETLVDLALRRGATAVTLAWRVVDHAERTLLAERSSAYDGVAAGSERQRETLLSLKRALASHVVHAAPAPVAAQFAGMLRVRYRDAPAAWIQRVAANRNLCADGTLHQAFALMEIVLLQEQKRTARAGGSRPCQGGDMGCAKRVRV